MKHLKQYENTITNTYKKFVIWEKNSPNDFLIIKIIHEEKDKVRIKTLFIYNKKTDELETIATINKKMVEYYKTYVNKHIIYQTDSLEDCKKELILKMTANKYNL